MGAVTASREICIRVIGGIRGGMLGRVNAGLGKTEASKMILLLSFLAFDRAEGPVFESHTSGKFLNVLRYAHGDRDHSRSSS